MSVARSLPVPALSSSSLTLSTGSFTPHHSDPALVPLPAPQISTGQRWGCEAEAAQLMTRVRQRNSSAVKADTAAPLPLLGLSVVTAEETSHPSLQALLSDREGGDRAAVTLPSLPCQPAGRTGGLGGSDLPFPSPWHKGDGE